MLFVKKLKQIHIRDLKCTKILHISGSEDSAYSKKWLKKKLEDKYSHYNVCTV